MELVRKPDLPISSDLLDAISALPPQREVPHCGASFQVPAFDFYATCPHCGVRMKVRSFSGVPELEDVFDAVFAWMGQPGADEVVRARREAIAEDD